MRPSWDEYFMEIVELIKTRSNKRILATSAVSGRNSMCLPDRGMSFAGQFTRSKTAARCIINAGIKKIVFKGDYPDELSMEMLKEAVCARL